MAEGPGNGADGGHAGSGNQRMPEPTTALRILELMKNESGVGDWALWLKAPLQHAVRRGDEDLTAALLDAGADPAQVDGGGASMLVVASREGHAGVISAIAARYPEGLHQAEAGTGYSALHLAATHNRTDAIDALVEAGANLEFQALDGWTALHTAAATIGCEAAVEALLRHDADKEQETDTGLTPLLLAVEAANEAAADVLIEAGASVVGGDDDDTVLDLAIRGGSSDGGARRDASLNLLRTLVQRGVSVDAGSNLGTAMHGAAWYDHGRAIDFLVEAGADVDAKAPSDGSAPFHTSAQTAGNLEAIRALASHGADINARRSNGDTPLHVAAGNCVFEQSAATVDALLRAGADETMVNAALETPADVLERSAADHEAEDHESVAQIRKLLANAPADRAYRVWARRRHVVMCRAFPGRVRLADASPSSPADSPQCKKAALREAGEGESGCRAEGKAGSDFSGAMGSLIGLQEADLFRAIVEFL